MNREVPTFHLFFFRWCLIQHCQYSVHMVEVRTSFEVVSHRTLCVRPCVLNGSFSYRSLSLTNIAFATAWTADFIHHIWFAQQRNFVFGRRKVFQTRCLEESIDLDFLLCIKESLQLNQCMKRWTIELLPLDHLRCWTAVLEMNWLICLSNDWRHSLGSHSRRQTSWYLEFLVWDVLDRIPVFYVFSTHWM